MFVCSCRVLANIHKVDLKATNLEDFGKQGNLLLSPFIIQILLIITSTSKCINAYELVIYWLWRLRVHCAREGNYMARNLQTWRKQYEQSLVEGEGDCEEMRLLIEWLNARLPAQVSLLSCPLAHSLQFTYSSSTQTYEY